MRPEYLKTISKEDFLTETVFEDEKSSEILDAGLITACECKAVDYLSRCEQCRAGLIKKLLDKGYQKEHIEPALDFLESKNYLSDSRFCRSWLNMRKINHAEGRTKLMNELLSRGIPKNTASTALDEFFMENDENEIAERCFQKLTKQGKTGDKLIAAMISRGFSWKTAGILVKNQGHFPEE